MKIHLRKKMRDMQMERYSGNALSRIVIADLKFLSPFRSPENTSRASANSEIAFFLFRIFTCMIRGLGREEGITQDDGTMNFRRIHDIFNFVDP